MERYLQPEIRINHGAMTKDELKEVLDLIEKRKLELTYDEEGKVKGWCKDDTYTLTKAKAGKVEILKRFPVAYNSEGEQVTPETLKDTDLTRLISSTEAHNIRRLKGIEEEKARVRAELEAVTIADLKKQYPDLSYPSKANKTQIIETIIEYLYNDNDNDGDEHGERELFK
jgi:hypothetical protein